jgi:hypothetical protein
MSAVQQEISLSEVSDEELRAALWRSGHLSWKLDPHQLAVYDKYRAWEKLEPGKEEKGSLRRIFVLDISRRWGKTFLIVTIKYEDAIRFPGSLHTFSTAFAKDIGEIILPLREDLDEDAPDDVKPEFRTSKSGKNQGLYFPNDSVIRLVGIDVNPRGLRGRRSDGFVVSEAGHVKNLAKTITSVVYPQFQRVPTARCILETNAPEELHHDFDEIFVPDAKLRDAYVFATIDDNTAITEEEREEFIIAAGGRDSPTCQREYYGKRVRDTNKAVIPEFSEENNVVQLELPAYADCYTALDPGVRDLCAILWGYWDFENARLCIQRAWAERNAGTKKIGELIHEVESELWSDLQRYSGGEFKPNPYLRVSDTDARLRHDLYAEFGLRIAPVNKSTNEGGSVQKELKEAGVHSVRLAIQNRQIVIDDSPETLLLRLHLANAEWNDHRTDYERSDKFGHFDLLDCLVYLWRAVRKNKNPMPPDLHDVSHDDKPVQHQVAASKIYQPQIDHMLFGKTEPEKRSWKRPKNNNWKRRGR